MATIAAVKHLLLEILNDLSDEELKKFKRLLKMIIHSIFPPKISCFTLMYYEPNTPFLRLHVYLIRQDPALEQEMDKKESSHGFKKISKPHPDKYLQTEHAFSLRADMETAEIQPKELTFRYNSLNFYEVFIENPGRQFHLALQHSYNGDPVDGPVWICKIQKEDHPLSGHTEVPSCSKKPSVNKPLSTQGRKALLKSDRKRHLSKDPEVKHRKKFRELLREVLEKFKRLLWDSAVLVELKPIPKSKLEEVNNCNQVVVMFGANTQFFSEEITVDKHLSAQTQKDLTVQSDGERILEMLEHLDQKELEKFKWLLVELKPIPKSKVEDANICKLVDLMVQTYTERSVEVTKKIFRKMNRNDLVKKLSDTSS